MKRTIQILAWLVVVGYALMGVGFVMMAIDGYDHFREEGGFDIASFVGMLG